MTPLASSATVDDPPPPSRPVPARPPLGPIARALAVLGPDFTCFLLFLALFVILGAIYGAHFHVAGEGSILIAAGIAAGILTLRFLWRARAILASEGTARVDFLVAARRILRDWGPMILLTVIFENLHAYTGLIRKVPIDDWLLRTDVALFGTEPSVWAGRFAHPLLTDYMSIAYGLYFVMPMVIAGTLSLRGRRADFRELATAMVLHMCIGFLGFIVFPAGPPRFYKPLLDGSSGLHFTPPYLHSFLFDYSQSAWDTVNPNVTHSSFPSMHCALATLTLCYAWRFGSAVFPTRPRAYFWICLPLVISLWASTVYLRHHWVPDCLAGMLLGAIVFVITPKLRHAWPGADAAAVS